MPFVSVILRVWLAMQCALPAQAATRIGLWPLEGHPQCPDSHQCARWDRAVFRSLDAEAGRVGAQVHSVSPNQAQLPDFVAWKRFFLRAEAVLRADATVLPEFQTWLESGSPGPALARQRAYAAASKLASLRGEKEEAQMYLDKALSLHPEGRLAFELDPPVTPWSKWAEQRQSASPTRCRVDVATEPPLANWVVDGFDLGKRTALNLVHEKTYSASVASAVHLPQELFLDCSQSGRWSEWVSLQPGHGPKLARLGEKDPLALRDMVRKTGVDSLMVGEPSAEGELSYFLYTPGIGWDRLRDLGGFKLASLGQEADPIPSHFPKAALTEALSRHKTSALVPKSAESAQAEYGFAMPAPLPEKTSWAKRNALWLILGVLGAGAAAAAVSGGSARRSTGVSGQVH